MRINNKEINAAKILYDFTQTMQDINSLEDIYKKTIALFKNKLPYDLAIFYMFDFTEKLVVKEKSGIDVNSDMYSDSPTNLFLLQSRFNKQQLQIIEKWKDQKELQKLFFVSDIIQTVVLLPFITANRILGFLCIGLKSGYDFKDNEKALLETIGYITVNSLRSYLLIEALNNHNQVLRNIAKNMRHDFANDIQTISLTIELFSVTELSDDQNKYLRLLNNAKNSAIEKLNELKSLKNKFDDEIEIVLGLPIINKDENISIGN
ncbi:MAG TPA: GAF domain-containing protein [Candidatus Bathyarchaeia archaeon]|nr:GAF domain-containing protein [Candidatus Bathyarchaeia archaeon]